MTQDLTAKTSTPPDWTRKASTGASFGNLDSSDYKPPRLKLLAGQSPEVMDGMPGAIPGNFWITNLNLNLGQTVTGTPIWLRKTYQVWAPKGTSDQNGPLAIASDGVNWDVPNQTFEVKFPGNPNIYKWILKKTVFETGSNKFGTQQPEDPHSKPIAGLTYDVLWLIELPNGRKELCLFRNARTGLTPTQNFLSAVRANGIDQYFQRWAISVKKKQGPTGDVYFTYDYQYLGPLQTEQEGVEARAVYEQCKSTNIDYGESNEDEMAPTPKTHEPKASIDEEIPF